MFDIPRDKHYPPDAVQCHNCGGHGCASCENKGWLPKGHANGRECLNPACGAPIRPNHVALYCSDDCAFADA
jgi:hypothetical protein